MVSSNLSESRCPRWVPRVPVFGTRVLGNGKRLARVPHTSFLRVGLICGASSSGGHHRVLIVVVARLEIFTEQKRPAAARFAMLGAGPRFPLTKEIHHENVADRCRCFAGAHLQPGTRFQVLRRTKD